MDCLVRERVTTTNDNIAIDEAKLRSRIEVLQEYVSMGVTTLKESIDYEKDKTSRVNALHPPL